MMQTTMEVSKKDEKFIHAALQAADKSSMLMKHGCVVVESNKIIGSGCNNYRTQFGDKFITKACSCHAEMHVLHKCLKVLQKKQIRKLTFYITRVSADGTLKISAPCKDCLIKLEQYNVKRLIYSIDDNKFISVRNRDYTTDFVTRSKKDYLNSL